MLEENPTKINYWYLPLNTAAIHLIEANLSSVNLENLSRNPNAMHILEKHQHLIDWFAIHKLDQRIPMNGDTIPPILFAIGGYHIVPWNAACEVERRYLEYANRSCAYAPLIHKNDKLLT